MPRTGSILLPAALFTLLSHAAFAAPQDVTLAFGSLPSAQGFTYAPAGSHAGTPEASVFSLSGGVLVQNSMGQSNGAAGGSILYQLSGIVTATEPKQLRVRARCLQVEGTANYPAGQQGFAFGFTTGSVQYDISLTPTGIYALGPAGSVQVPGTYDNTAFHDYILDYAPPGTIRIFRDGVLLFTSSSGFGVAANRVFFGDGTGGANARAEIAALRFLQGDFTTPVLQSTWGRLKSSYRD